MSEDKPAKVASGFLASLLPFIPEPIRFFMGWFSALALLYAFMYAIIFMPTYFRNFAESNVKASEFCWELREIQKNDFQIQQMHWRGDSSRNQGTTSHTAAEAFGETEMTALPNPTVERGAILSTI